jgi:hypothetical protein
MITSGRGPGGMRADGASGDRPDDDRAAAPLTLLIARRPGGFTLITGPAPEVRSLEDAGAVAAFVLAYFADVP